LTKFQIKLFSNQSNDSHPSSCSLRIDFDSKEEDRQANLEEVFLNKIYISQYPLLSCTEFSECQECAFHFEGETKREKCSVKLKEKEGYDLVWAFKNVTLNKLDSIIVNLIKTSMTEGPSLNQTEEPLSNQCESFCDKGEYLDFNQTCKNCNEKCLTCSGPSHNNCLTCASPLIFDDDKNICATACESRKYSYINGAVRKCVSNCFGKL
jgi:hypothetical protein